MPTRATGPIRRPGQRRAERRPTSAIIDNISSELALAPAITHSGEPRDPVVPAMLAVPASTNT
jgi:hypothetical protein